MSSLKKRSSTGQFVSEQSPAEQAGVMLPYVETPSKSSRTGSKQKSSGSFVKSAFKIVLSGKKDEPLMDYKEELANDCHTIYTNAKFFSMVTKALHAFSQIVKMVVTTYFVLNVFMQGILYSLTTTLLNCALGKGQRCFSRLTEIIIPNDMVTTSPHVQATLRESGTIGSEPIFVISFPLTIGNPLIQLLILLILVCTSFFMAYFQRVLVKIARLARDASPEQNFEAKYGKLPKEI